MERYVNIIKNGYRIGTYALSIYEDEKAIGIGSLEIYPEFRNKGYGTETIKRIVNRYKGDYDIIYCFVDSDNIGAIRLYERLGKVYKDIKNDDGQYFVIFYKKKEKKDSFLEKGINRDVFVTDSVYGLRDFLYGRNNEYRFLCVPSIVSSNGKPFWAAANAMKWTHHYIAEALSEEGYIHNISEDYDAEDWYDGLMAAIEDDSFMYVPDNNIDDFSKSELVEATKDVARKWYVYNGFTIMQKDGITENGNKFISCLGKPLAVFTQRKDYLNYLKTGKTSSSKYTFDSLSDIEKKAKEHFGITNDFKKCFYILSDGSFLDGTASEYSEGRDYDHREISSIYEGTDDYNGYMSMKNFMKQGAVRAQPESFSVQLLVKPTDAQIRAIANEVRKGNINYIEISKGDMDLWNPNNKGKDVYSYIDAVNFIKESFGGK